MKIKILFFLIAFFAFGQPIFAEENSSIKERVVASAFKNLAKAYVAVIDFEKLKIENISRILPMKGDEFKRRFSKVYEVMKDLPDGYKATYGIDENMNKKQFIKKINLYHEKEAFAMINDFPDKIIIKYFKGFINKRAQEVKSCTMADKIKIFWSRVKYEIERK